MYVCYVCDCNVLGLTSFKSHMRFHEAFGQIVLPIKCMQPNCSSYFSKVCSMFRHLDKYHATDDFRSINNVSMNDLVGSSSSQTVQQAADIDDELDTAHRPSLPTSTSCNNSDKQHESMQQEAVCLVASLRANSSIPYSVIPDILQSCQHMINIALQEVHCKVVNEIEMTQDCRLNIESLFEQSTDQLKFLTSRYKQDKFFEMHELFVKPEECVFRSRHDVNRNKNKIVYDTYQYVSVEANLRALMKSEAYVRMLLMCMETSESTSCISEFRDGETYRARYSDSSKFTILLQLFYDGMGTTNPLRGNSAALCNMGVFYYVIKNLSNTLNSCHANVHLLSLCYSADLKAYGYEAILDKFVSEINRLSCDGFSGNFPIIGEKTIYVKLCQVVCDNLALNGIFGFVECFVWDYFCTLCTARQETIQTCFEESLFTPRTYKSYGSDLVAICNAEGRQVHVHGVKRRCALNDIDGYHILDNYALDPMHILLEGVVPLEMGCVLYMLITVKKLVTLTELNRRIISYFDHDWVDKKNRPPELNTLEQMGNSLSPSMKAVQCWTLLRFLPILLGSDVDKDDKFWIFLLHLSHLVDLVFAPKFTNSMISYLRQVISDHLLMFLELFGDHVRLRAKHHLMVHLPTVILKSGPLVGMCCLKFELKNCFFKRSASTMSNFMNVCKTLAYRHQYSSLYAMLSGSHIRDFVFPGKVVRTVLSLKPYCQSVMSFYGCESTEVVDITTKLVRASVTYNVGSVVVIGESRDMPVFGKIICFLSVHGKEWLIIVQEMHTCHFDSHYHAYCVRCSASATVYRALIFKELKDYHSLFLFKVTMGKIPTFLVRMPYHVIASD